MTTDRHWPDGHFHSPVPSADDIARALEWRDARDVLAIPGVAIDLDAMWRRADQLAQAVGTYRLSDGPDDARLYSTRNDWFNAADAGILAAVLAHTRPRRVVEIGSGPSTACILDTRDAFQLPFRLVTIDPLPDVLFDLVGSGPRPHFHLLALPAARIGLEPFLALEAGDVLFVDTSHVAKAGSDVLFVFLEILPRLAPGVLVHVHDILPGFEYPPDWLTGGRHWNEAYLLRALLIGNRDCRIDFWGALLAARDRARFRETFPIAEGTVGGSLWLRITGRSAAETVSS